jgi:hypothetical protein
MTLMVRLVVAIENQGGYMDITEQRLPATSEPLELHYGYIGR